MNYLAATERFFNDKPGGSGRVAWELARLMRRRGHEVALLCGREGGDPRPDLVECEGVTVARYRYPRLKGWDPRRLAAHIEAAAQAVDVLGTARWHVVHGHNLAPALAAFEMLQAERRIATVHSPAVLEQRITWRSAGWVGWVKLALGEPALKRAERRLYSQADSVSALSRYTIQEMTTLFGAEMGQRIRCIPWWSEPVFDRGPAREEARQRLGWPEGPIVYTLRRLVPRMGLDVMLDAIERLPETPPFHLLIAGDGPERTRLEERARRIRHHRRIRFLGRITDDDADLAYRAADVFVLPTRSLECFGIIALEAMARGLPVIGARVGAIPEVLDPVLTDWMFEPGDPGSLASRLIEFLTRTKAMPTRCELWTHVRDRYDSAVVGEAYARWIEEGACGY